MAGQLSIRRYPYPGFTVYDCEAPGGTEYRHTEGRLQYGIGAFYYRGRMASAIDAETGAEADAAVLVDACGFIPADPTKVRNFDVIYGPDGCGFLCVSRDARSRITCRHIRVAGEFILPSGVGAVVATGTARVGERTYTRCLYVLPGEADRPISPDGPADLLLIEPAA